MVDPRVEVETARRYLVGNWQSFSNVPENAWRIAKIQEGIGGGVPEHVNIWYSLPARILTASPHLQGGDIPWDKVQELREQGMGLFEALDALEV